MNSRYRLQLPDDIAHELVAEGLAVPARRTRSMTAATIATLTTDGINTGSAIVTLAMATPVARRLASKLLRRRTESDPDTIELTATRAGKVERLRLDRSAPEAESQACDFLVAAFGDKD